jgi:hypothetical protein
MSLMCFLMLREQAFGAAGSDNIVPLASGGAK